MISVVDWGFKFSTLLPSWLLSFGHTLYQQLNTDV